MQKIASGMSWGTSKNWANASDKELQELLRIHGDDGFTDTVVSKRVNSHVNDDPACIEPAIPVAPVPPNNPRDSGRLF